MDDLKKVINNMKYILNETMAFIENESSSYKKKMEDLKGLDTKLND